MADRRTGVGDPYAVVAGIPRLQDMAIGAGMRTGDARAGIIAQDALERRHAFEDEWAVPRFPIDWRLWVRTLTDVSASVHGGMTGVADTSFFSGIERYAEKQSAPPEARAAVAFLKGLAGWDFASASRAADVLLAREKASDLWIDPDLLRDGAVIAKLRIGDLSGARETFKAATPWSLRPVTDLRARLLFAYVSADDTLSAARAGSTRGIQR
jgi:hypothetical protein